MNSASNRFGFHALYLFCGNSLQTFTLHGEEDLMFGDRLTQGMERALKRYEDQHHECSSASEGA